VIGDYDSLEELNAAVEYDWNNNLSIDISLLA